MPHILGPMDAEDFFAGAEVGKFRLTHIWEMHKGNHPLQKIHAKLVQYHGMAKPLLDQRYQILRDITAMCVAYAGSKPPEKLGSGKLQCVFRLAVQCTNRIVLEQARAQQLQQRLRNPIIGGARARLGHGVRVGGPTTEVPTLRFERLNRPGESSIRGDDLIQLAQTMGCPITGDETRDFYSMKKLLKLLKTRHAVELDLLYMNAEQRERFRLVIHDDGLIRLPRNPWNTTADSENFYACSMAGVFYGGANNEIRNAFPELLHQRGIQQWRVQHSSFLGGGDVMGAGTISVKNGKLRFLSNRSGHYGPTLANLWDCCVAIRENGAEIDEAYALVSDFQKECDPARNQVVDYMVPMSRFIGLPNGQMNAAGWRAYELAPSGRWDVVYADPNAARLRGCRHWLVPGPLE